MLRTANNFSFTLKTPIEIRSTVVMLRAPGGSSVTGQTT
jgi:hypothetical protein